MSLPDDLLAQAELLAKHDPKRPKQANLRRAVSAAYYGLFHFLVHEACCVVFGTQNSQRHYRHALARSFSHTSMKQACASFGGGTLKEAVIRGLPRNATGRYVIPSAIKDIANLFVELQDDRHRADYDLATPFERSGVLTQIEETRDFMGSFAQLAASDDKRFFLACLWAWKDLSNR